MKVFGRVSSILFVPIMIAGCVHYQYLEVAPNGRLLVTYTKGWWFFSSSGVLSCAQPSDDGILRCEDLEVWETTPGSTKALGATVRVRANGVESDLPLQSLIGRKVRIYRTQGPTYEGILKRVERTAIVEVGMVEYSIEIATIQLIAID